MTRLTTSVPLGINPSSVWNQGNIFGEKRFYASIIYKNAPPEMDSEDSRDLAIALQRLHDLRQSPEKTLRGEALEKKMKEWIR